MILVPVTQNAVQVAVFLGIAEQDCRRDCLAHQERNVVQAVVLEMKYSRELVIRGVSLYLKWKSSFGSVSALPYFLLKSIYA